MDKLWIQLPHPPPPQKENLADGNDLYPKLAILESHLRLKSEKSTDNPLSTPVIWGLHHQ